MNKKLEHPTKAFQYLDKWHKTSLSSMADNQLAYLLKLLINDMENQNYSIFKEYMNQILSHLPIKILPLFLENIIHSNDPEWFQQNCINFLIHANRPIYQIKGLQIIQKNNDETLIPLAIPLIYHSHLPLQQEAIKTIIQFPSISEPILENALRSRSEKKLNIVKKVLNQLNPNNIKLAVAELNNPDFLIRVNALKILGSTGDRKWITKILPFLEDDDMAVRKAAIEALSQLGGRKAKQILSQTLIREDYPPLKLIIQKQLKKW
ncbi:MAG: HEAT repeat domain-containing protein [Candidatus Lokiarchaeota archaeon]|nr:HEAT repeat domain-containing protein [Candidatus Harpocratesius repetitus]